MNIDISTRLYNDIVQWCEANALEPIKYIEKTLRERLATDKYGDLNEKMRQFIKPESRTVVDIPVPETANESECDLVVIPHEKTETEPQPEEVSGNEPSGKEKQTEKKPTKRTLKTK